MKPGLEILREYPKGRHFPLEIPTLPYESSDARGELTVLLLTELLEGLHLTEQRARA